MLILTETDVEEGAALTREAAQARRARSGSRVEGNPELSVTISIGIAGGIGPAAPDGRRSSATPTRRCTRPSRSAATRPTSSRSPTRTPASRARRSPTPAGPGRWRSAGRRATRRRDALTSVIAPLPHYRGQPSALIAVDRRRDGPPARAARGRGRPDPGRGAPPRRRQGRGPAGDPRQAGGAHVGRVADRSSSTRASARSSSSRRPRSRTPCRSSSTTTSAIAGHGYPFGLRGNEIPLGARIVAIADAYDAMTHDRPYKRAMSPRRGDRRAAPPRRDAVRPRARRRSSATCTRTGSPTPDPTVLAITHAAQPADRRERKVRAADVSSGTLAADGHGLVELDASGDRRRPAAARATAPDRAPTTAGSPPADRPSARLVDGGARVQRR